MGKIWGVWTAYLSWPEATALENTWNPSRPLTRPRRGGGVPEIFGTHSHCGFLKKKIGTCLETAGKMVSSFFSSDPKFSGHTPAAGSEGVPTRKSGHAPNCRKIGVLIFSVGGGHGTPSTWGRRDSLSSTDPGSEKRKTTWYVGPCSLQPPPWPCTPVRCPLCSKPVLVTD